MAHHLNTNKQFMIGNGILAFAVIFVVVIFVYMSMRLQRQKEGERHFAETYNITLVKALPAIPSPSFSMTACWQTGASVKSLSISR